MAGMVTLSKRMQSVADMVTPGTTVCDVGCDHGFVSIYLVQQGISSKLIAMDINKGPLTRAEKHIKERHLSKYIETRLSDGLNALKQGEAETMICAGMGGRLMMEILTTQAQTAHSLKELILQPQSEVEMFRRFLRQSGYVIIQEDMVCEDGKFYPVMKAVWQEGNTEPEGALMEEGFLAKRDLFTVKTADRYGKLLLEKRHPILKEYLLYKKKMYQKILKGLSDSTGQSKKKEKRMEEMKGELNQIAQILFMWDK